MVPGTAQIDLTAGDGRGAPEPHPDSLLVLYLGDERRTDRRGTLSADPIAPSNPYWSEHGLTFEDPDDFGSSRTGALAH